MRVKLKNKINEGIAAVYLPNGNAIKPYFKDWYHLDTDIEYKIVCAKHTYLYKNNKIKQYNYL